MVAMKNDYPTMRHKMTMTTYNNMIRRLKTDVVGKISTPIITATAPPSNYNVTISQHSAKVLNVDVMYPVRPHHIEIKGSIDYEHSEDK